MKAPIGKHMRVIALRVTQAYEYKGTGANRQKTDTRQTTAAGAAMTRISGMAAVLGDELVDVTIEATDAQAEGVEPGQIVALDGALVAEIRGGDFGSVRATVTGVEAVKPLAIVTDVLNSI